VEWIQNCRSLDELKKIYTDAYNKYEDSPSALKVIVAAKKQRKQEIENGR
jgi:hypothetical protein